MWVVCQQDKENKKHIDIFEHLTSARDRQSLQPPPCHDKCPTNVFRMNFGFISVPFVCVAKLLDWFLGGVSG